MTTGATPPALERKGCPFCGLPPTQREYRYSDETGERTAYVAIECLRHEIGGAEPTLFVGVHADTEAAAITAWNRRAFGTEAAGEVVRLRVSVERACEAIENLHLGFRDAALRVRAALSPHAKEESNAKG